MQTNEKMEMKAIDNIQGLEQLENQLSNPLYVLRNQVPALTVPTG